jgi:putative effector of murein hydrolase
MEKILLLFALVIAISAYEIYQMIKYRFKNELIMYVIITAATLALGVFYFSNTYRESLSHMIVRLMGLYRKG